MDLPRHPTSLPYADQRGDKPAGRDLYYKWIAGVIVPLALAWRGVLYIVNRRALFPFWRSYGNTMLLNRPQSIACGIACVGLAVFLNCEHFWKSIYDEFATAAIAKVISLLALIGGLGFVICSVFCSHWA